MWQLQPPEKSYPPLSQQTPSKSWGPVKPPIFENLIGGSTTLFAERGGGYAHYDGIPKEGPHCIWQSVILIDSVSK